MRLDLADLFSLQQGQPRHPVRFAAPEELLQFGQLGLLGRDDQFADTPVGDAPLIAIGCEQRRPLNTQPGLQRAGRVIDAWMDDPAVVTALVTGYRSLLF